MASSRGRGGRSKADALVVDIVWWIIQSERPVVRAKDIQFEFDLTSRVKARILDRLRHRVLEPIKPGVYVLSPRFVARVIERLASEARLSESDVRRVIAEVIGGG